MAIGLASINLSLRTYVLPSILLSSIKSYESFSIAVWSRSVYVVIPIILFIIGHWSLLIYGIRVTAYWEPALQTCVINSIPAKIEAAIFLYRYVASERVRTI